MCTTWSELQPEMMENCIQNSIWLFQVVSIPEGLTNAPTAFQRFMNDVFADMIDVTVIIYLDDILIYSGNMSEHNAMFRRYSEDSELTDSLSEPISASFTSPLVNTSDICYHLKALPWHHTKSRLSRIGPNLEKLKTFNCSSVLPISTDVSLQILWNHCTLTPLTWKGTIWNFTDECRSAFEALKNVFTTAPVLTHWIPDTQIMVETDASDYALTAVLSITTRMVNCTPLAFHSRTFSAPELNYDVHDKELLAIFEAFKWWRHYLEGSSLLIDVVTDHRNLAIFFHDQDPHTVPSTLVRIPHQLVTASYGNSGQTMFG